jgi:salicylate hydroxylase
MLLQTARELGAETRVNAEVVEVAEDCRSVRLASGEVLHADVIIGADGSQGMCRALVVPQDPPNATGVMLFKWVLPLPYSPCFRLPNAKLKLNSSVIPADRIRADPELCSLVEQEQVIITYRSVMSISS